MFGRHASVLGSLCRHWRSSRTQQDDRIDDSLTFPVDYPGFCTFGGETTGRYKLDQCKLLLRDFSVRSKVSKRELQSLIGVLNFACSVVVPGRPFLRRLIYLTSPSHPLNATG